MKRGVVANDNKELDHGIVDPDRHFVATLMREAFDYLKNDGIDRMTIASVLLDELFRTLEGNPFRTNGDEGAIRADLQFLWSMKHRIVPMTEQWEKGWLRLQRQKSLVYQFNVAAPLPVAAPAPRGKAGPVDYDSQLHTDDLSLLRLRPGLDYSEKEVRTRYRRKLLQALNHDNDLVRTREITILDGAMKRLTDWLSRSKGRVTHIKKV